MKNKKARNILIVSITLAVLVGATVALVGYADRETGTTKGNLELSKKRAAVVSARLAKLGVDENRISSDYKGDTVQPFAENAKNRVVICTLE